MKKLAGIILILVLASTLFSADKTFETFQVSYVILDQADFSLTLYGLHRGHEEANPLARWYTKSPALTVAVHATLNIAVIKLSGFLYKKDKKLGWAVVIGLNLIKGYVVYRNIRTLTKEE